MMIDTQFNQTAWD